ncbi:hypothetical protein [Streptomyces sp. NPDC046197]|uniref:hypothetical protein n=1 Tax=Streptomyces sp. NPDC046197 TaxID=3154337 RepID=UPI0033EB6E29
MIAANPVMRWALSHGMYVMGAAPPRIEFTAQEGADARCQAGAQGLALARIYDWLDDTHPRPAVSWEHGLGQLTTTGAGAAHVIAREVPAPNGPTGLGTPPVRALHLPGRSAPNDD